MQLGVRGTRRMNSTRRARCVPCIQRTLATRHIRPWSTPPTFGFLLTPLLALITHIPLPRY